MIGLVIKNTDGERGTVMSAPHLNSGDEYFRVVVMWDDYSISTEFIDDLEGVTPEEFLAKENEDKVASAVLTLVPGTDQGGPDDTTH